ncbi:MAG: hypothetical protein WB973_03360 [Thermoanaerobaculia bacterium]
MPPTPRRLVLFDIDGTLITDDGAAREAFAEGLAEVYGFVATCAATTSPAAPIRRSRR